MKKRSKEEIAYEKNERRLERIGDLIRRVMRDAREDAIHGPCKARRWLRVLDIVEKVVSLDQGADREIWDLLGGTPVTMVLYVVERLLAPRPAHLDAVIKRRDHTTPVYTVVTSEERVLLANLEEAYADFDHAESVLLDALGVRSLDGNPEDLLAACGGAHIVKCLCANLSDARHRRRRLVMTLRDEYDLLWS